VIGTVLNNIVDRLDAKWVGGHGNAAPLRKAVFYAIVKGVGKARRRYRWHN
jgi:hypothetical protein